MEPSVEKIDAVGVLDRVGKSTLSTGKITMFSAVKFLPTVRINLCLCRCRAAGLGSVAKRHFFMWIRGLKTAAESLPNH